MYQIAAGLAISPEQVLKGARKVKAEVAKVFAEKEFEKYRVIQDQNYLSDFDKLLLESSRLENKE
ncbi:MAG: hypothetical protein LBS41_01630 [Streptococcaceae bacterium]|jgi:hypothetical protein|nr:hypothetical protein [Streptococcaceae bacterium]